MLLFGVFGLWSFAMDTLIITGVSVGFCMLIGIPIGIWMARKKSVSTVVTPDPRRDADLPAVLLPRPDGAVLRHRPGHGDRR